jgi:hypothetical protein
MVRVLVAVLGGTLVAVAVPVRITGPKRDCGREFVDRRSQSAEL